VNVLEQLLATLTSICGQPRHAPSAGEDPHSLPPPASIH